MARRAPKSESSNYLVISVIGVVVVLAVVGGVFITATRKPFVPYSRRVRREPEKTIGDDLDEVRLADPTVVSTTLPPYQQAYQLLANARKIVCIKDLPKALSMCEQALRVAPAYAGDAYFSMGMCQTEHAIINKLPYARQNEAGRKKIELYRRAIEAYGQPGAKTGWAQSVQRRIDTIKTSIKMENNATEWRQRQIEGGVLAPRK